MDARYEDGYDPKYGYNRNAFANKPPQLKAMSKLVGLISTPIALASEAIAHNKTKTDPEKPNERSVVVDNTVQVQQDNDDADWELDEAADELEAARGAEGARRSSPSPTRPTATATALPFPVILPQRRPGTKTRGFVRAYAPILADFGISERQHLKFLDGLHQAAQAQPVLQVIQITAGIASFYPDVAVALGMQAVQVAAGAAQEAYERWNTNVFLDQANKDIFMPKGLYCMVVTYKPGGAEEKALGGVIKKTIDLAAPAVAAKESSSKLQDRLKKSSGQTVGEAEMPLACAPLVYPALDQAGQPAATDLKGATARSSRFVADYFDRRARMVEATQRPDGTLTALSGGKPEFASKMGDPNDGRNKHLITLLTGGMIQAQPLGAKRRWEKAKRKENERVMRGLKTTPKKRFLQEDILYLMVVNLPGEDALREARKVLQQRQ